LLLRGDYLSPSSSFFFLTEALFLEVRNGLSFFPDRKDVVLPVAFSFLFPFPFSLLARRWEEIWPRPE